MLQVDMTWHGHHHSYQRTCQVQSQRCRGHNGALQFLCSCFFCQLSRNPAPVLLLLSQVPASAKPISVQKCSATSYLFTLKPNPYCAEDGSATAPVHLVIGNAGAELCWNVAPKTPNHFEVQWLLSNAVSSV